MKLCGTFSPIYLPMGIELISSYHQPQFLCLRVQFPNQICVNFQAISVSYFQSNKTGMDLFCISSNVIIHSNSHCLTISFPQRNQLLKSYNVMVSNLHPFFLRYIDSTLRISIQFLKYNRFSRLPCDYAMPGRLPTLAVCQRRQINNPDSGFEMRSEYPVISMTMPPSSIDVQVSMWHTG